MCLPDGYIGLGPGDPLGNGYPGPRGGPLGGTDALGGAGGPLALLVGPW